MLSACGEKWPCINGKGDIVSENRALSGFTEINSEIEATVYITQGAEFDLRIEAQQNILDNIETDVSGNALEIHADHCMNNSEQIKIYVTLPVVTALDLSGSGAIIIQNKLNSPSLDLNVSGSGEITGLDSLITGSINLDISGSGNIQVIANTPILDASISGSGNLNLSGVGSTLNIDISGSGNYNGFYFTILTADIKVSGSGKVETNVASTLDVDISGSGDIYYKGTPAVTAEISGSGQLIHVD